MPSGIKGSNRKYNCLYCNKENMYGHSKINKYCDNVCQGKYRWINETIPRIENGNKTEPSTVKKYLIEKFGNKCVECGQENSWNNKPLMLQLDHIDGDSDNSFLNNLRLLCPNCHTQTETYGNAGKGNRYKKLSKRNLYLQEYKRVD